MTRIFGFEHHNNAPVLALNLCCVPFNSSTRELVIASGGHRAGSWSLRALRHECDCGPLVHYICNIDLILVPFLLLPSLLRNVVYVRKQLFLHNLLQDNASWNALHVERGLLHLNIHIVYSKFQRTKWSYFVNFRCTGRSGSLLGLGP